MKWYVGTKISGQPLRQSGRDSGELKGYMLPCAFMLNRFRNLISAIAGYM